MRPIVVVAGGVNLDLVVRTPRLPRPGETVRGGDLVQAPGGKGANQATAVARLGGEARLLALTGDDVHGKLLRASLADAGVETTWVGEVPGAPSGVALIPVAADGQNLIIVAPGANARADAATVSIAAPTLFAAAHVAVGQMEWPFEAIRAFLALTPPGVLRIVNAAPAQREALSLLDGVDWLVVNEPEASLLSDVEVVDARSAARAGRALLGYGLRNAAITLGAAGVVCVNQRGATHQLAPAVQVVDTTAAGDAFVGALAFALADSPPEAALRTAVAAGSLACTVLGAQPSLPSRQAVAALLPSVPPARALGG